MDAHNLTSNHSLSRVQHFIAALEPSSLVQYTYKLAQEFVLFDRWFGSVPGPTNPNRAFATSGTSAGHGYNDDDFLTSAFTQKSIFQQLSEHGISWFVFNSLTPRY
jgi:phospholipase C